MPTPKAETVNDTPAGLLPTTDSVQFVQHHIPALKAIQKALKLETIQGAALWALAYAACNPSHIIVFAEHLNAYAGAEGVDIELLVNARIAEAIKSNRRRKV